MDSVHRAKDAEIDIALDAVTRIWSDVLGVPPSTLSPEDNFFAVGGDSLLIVQVMERINAQFFENHPQTSLSVTEFFAHPTPLRLAQRLTRASTADQRKNARDAQPPVPNGGIAIVGMSGRFPGASSVDALWSNLCSGIESIRTFTPAELLESGVQEPHLASPNYVKRGVCLEGLDRFDARYFGLSPREAALLCPQQRLLLECAEEALEHAGYGLRQEGLRVGVFVGTRRSIYLTEWLNSRAGFFDTVEGRLALVANSGSATRISYLLDLTGPSLDIDTACSSSLVAVHQACRSLMQGECDLALAGGAAITQLAPKGYWYETDGIVSADGRCRPFDQNADGTVFTSGAGMVLLRRLNDARFGADTIHAVIRGSAVNNDGRAKVGYTAPSQSGQASVIREALEAAGVSAAHIDFIETHGTGTALGDPIEIAALREVFRESDGVRTTLGAMKANVGHMEAAAGIGGLIKAVCALAAKKIPPAVNFNALNPRIDLAGSGLSVNTTLQDWPSQGRPRRAGVSSFGIGGTNAHVILEEAPGLIGDVEISQTAREVARSDGTLRPVHLLPLSAKTPSALREYCRNLAAYLKSASVSLADVAYTLQVGRTVHEYRTFVLAETLEGAAQRLLECASRSSLVSETEHSFLVPPHLKEATGRRVPLPTYPFERQRHWIERERATPVTEPVQAASVQPIGEVISELWRKALGVDAVDAEDDFFELGGDSLMAVQLSAALQARLGRPIVLSQWIRQPTISGITQLLQTEAGEAQ